MPDRSENRSVDSLRPFRLDSNVPGAAAGKVLVSAGRTTILCTASIEDAVPPWLAGRGKGWVTAEYNMLPGSTSPRKQRDRGGKVDGRSSEIQRLIGRSLRGVVNLKALGERTITVDCDVLEADGGTRTASITGGYVALAEAIASLPEFHSGDLPFTDSIAAVSVGIVDGEPLLDLDYSEDVRADVDMNVVMTGSGRFVEVQGSGEEATFDKVQLYAMIDLAERGIAQLSQQQASHLSE
ncbi:ribonuclease PH [Bythopirellula goksoeyrii]|uniref:Ribonuclease PH n=1 Tax=Bythopirellula goksoeyrii TaxID=1400387 RepID=A0A5B9Q9K8_9BACT|nr:ribonuclease PH [Bythopirellula goksoeyrii]QEG34265.1 Ribonuclease PH [Bythopirellula goksoeyrii]